MAHLHEGSTGYTGALVLLHFLEFNLQLGAGGATLDLPPEIVNLRDVTGKPVAPVHLGKDETNKVFGRVTLDAGAATARAPGACWDWGPAGFRRLSNELTWTIPGMEGTSLTLVPRDSEGNELTGKPRPTLHPVTVGGESVINMFVHHIPPGDLPFDPEDHPQPPLGSEAHHFGAYFSLFGGPVPIRLPKFWGAGKECGAVVPSDIGTTGSRGGSPYNCMLAADWP
jgi:hypothetical protein